MAPWCPAATSWPDTEAPLRATLRQRIPEAEAAKEAKAQARATAKAAAAVAKPAQAEAWAYREKPETRWGRRATCQRLVRPRLSIRGKAYLLCPNFSYATGGHMRRCLSQQGVVLKNLPGLYIRRSRIEF